MIAFPGDRGGLRTQSFALLCNSKVALFVDKIKCRIAAHPEYTFLIKSPPVLAFRLPAPRLLPAKTCNCIKT